MRKGLLFAARSWKDGTTSGVQIFFVNYFSPLAKWCGPSGNSYSALSFGWNLWVFFLSLKLRFSFEKKNSKISSSGQSRVWISFGTTSFCRRRKIIDKKNLHSLSFPILHDLLANKSPFLILLAGIFSLRDRSPSFPAKYHTKIHKVNLVKIYATDAFLVGPWSDLCCLNTPVNAYTVKMIP